MDAYRRLARRLDTLPNGFPATTDGCELRILEKLFTSDQADLASQLGSDLETPEEIAARTRREARRLRDELKAMARGGLIEVGRRENALGFKIMPFVVGIYEMQLHSMDAELASLVEHYFQGAFGGMLSIEPQFHRVVPTHDATHAALEIQPFESTAEILGAMQSWAVQECICRKQKALIGQACKHPLDVCLVMDPRPRAFDGAPSLRALNREEAMQALREAAGAGLVHTVSNSIEGTFYVCNCCTCSCGILRGIAERGLANVVARSAFVNQVSEVLCTDCGACVDACQFSALSVDGALVRVDRDRCVGCGVCTLSCTAEALALRRRPEEEVKPVPRTQQEWGQLRLAARGI